MKKDYLEMIQKVIDRMGNNSFLLKGWAVLVIVALFTSRYIAFVLLNENKKVNENITKTNISFNLIFFIISPLFS